MSNASAGVKAPADPSQTRATYTPVYASYDATGWAIPNLLERCLAEVEGEPSGSFTLPQIVSPQAYTPASPSSPSGGANTPSA